MKLRLFGRKDKAQPQEVKSSALLFGFGAARLMNTNYLAFADEGYGQNSVVKSCVDKVAQSLASVDLHVYRESKGKIQKLDDHKLLALMDRPNPLMSGRQFRQALASYYLIGGNAFTFGAGMDRENKQPPRELYLLPPECVTVRESPRVFPDRYEYRSKQGLMATYSVDQLTGRSEVLHSKTFNPLDTWRGLSPMVAAAFGIDVFNAGQKWNLALLQNGARPPGALMVKAKDGSSAALTDQQFARIKSMIDEQYSGPANAGRPLLLEGGLEWTEMGTNPKDMDYRESMLTMARFVAAVYGVPPMLVNIPGESTYANFEQARMALWTDTVLPLLGTLLDDFNRWFAPILGEGTYLWYDEEMIPALEPLRKAKGERINASTYMTINEKREAMGYEAIKGGDTVLVPSSNVPLELAGQIDLAEPGSPADEED